MADSLSEQDSMEKNCNNSSIAAKQINDFGKVTTSDDKAITDFLDLTAQMIARRWARRTDDLERFGNYLTDEHDSAK